MAALSAKSKTRLDIALADKKASAALQDSVNARSALSAKIAAICIVALSLTKAQAAEFKAAVASGADLSRGLKRRCLIAMGGEVAGNELINFIQSSPSAKVKL